MFGLVGSRTGCGRYWLYSALGMYNNSKLSHLIIVWRTDRTSKGLKWKWRYYISWWYWSSCLQMEQGDQRVPDQEHVNHFDQSVYKNEYFSDVSGSFTACADAKICKLCKVMLMRRKIKNTNIMLRSRFTFWMNSKAFLSRLARSEGFIASQVAALL